VSPDRRERAATAAGAGTAVTAAARGERFALLGGDCVAISCPVGGARARTRRRYEAREGEE